MKSNCTICDEVRELTFLALYVNGSEGCYVCDQCRRQLTEMARMMQSLAGRSRLKIIKEMRDK